MAHDREFQRKRKDTRMPVRDSHGEDQPAARQTEQDFDLRRARDTPSSVNGKTHRQDIPVQTEFSRLSPETPESLLEQGEAYATALDGFSEHFETPDAARTAPPIQDNVRSNFRQEASRRFLVTENATDHDTGKYAPSSECPIIWIICSFTFTSRTCFSAAMMNLLFLLFRAGITENKRT